MKDNDQKLAGLLYRLLEVDPGTEPEEISQDTYKQWDSSKHLSLIMELEALFGLSFKIEDVTEMRSFDDIVLCLRRYGIDI